MLQNVFQSFPGSNIQFKYALLRLNLFYDIEDNKIQKNLND